MIEFALVLGLFVLLLLGVVNYGAAYNHQLVVTTAADNASRYASFNSYQYNSSAYAASSACGAAYTSCYSATIEGIAQQTNSSLGLANQQTTAPSVTTSGVTGVNQIEVTYYKVTCAAGDSCPSPDYQNSSSTRGQVVCGEWDASAGTFVYKTLNLFGSAVVFTAYTGTSSSTSCGGPGDIVDVKISAHTAFFLPVLSDLFTNGLVQTSETQSVISQ